MQANLHKALSNFNQDTLEQCGKEAEFKAIIFSLCYFHAVVAERRKFGPQGWNKIYPFNMGDLTISVLVLYNYLENNSKIPWEDLRYLFGEIMYGGHITDDWDRKLCISYLEEYLQTDLVKHSFKTKINFACGYTCFRLTANLCSHLDFLHRQILITSVIINTLTMHCHRNHLISTDYIPMQKLDS